MEMNDEKTYIFGYGSLMWNPMLPQERKVAGFVQGFSRKFYQLSIDYRGTLDVPGRIATAVPGKDDILYGVAYKIDDPERILQLIDRYEKDGYQRMNVQFCPKYNDKSLIKKTQKKRDDQDSQTLSESSSIYFTTNKVSKAPMKQKQSHRQTEPSLGKNERTTSFLSTRRATEFLEKAKTGESSASGQRDLKTIGAIMYVGSRDNYLYSYESNLDEIAKQIVLAHGTAGSNSEYVFKIAQCMREYWPEIYDNHLYQIEAKVIKLLGLNDSLDANDAEEEDFEDDFDSYQELSVQL